MYLLPHEEEQAHSIVHRYEKMVKDDSVGFLDTRQFDALLDHYETTEQIDKALQVANYAIEQHGYSAHFYVKKAELLLNNDSEREALECLEKASSLDTTEMEIYLLKAEALAALDQHEEAMLVLEEAKALSTSDDRIEILKVKAGIYEMQGEYEQAFNTLAIGLKLQPTDEDILTRIWLIVEISGLYEKSIQLHEPLVDEAPYSKLIWYNHAHALLNLERYGQAAESFEYAYLIDEKFESAYLDRATALFRLELYEKAIECYECALEYIEPDANLHTQMGLCFEQLKNCPDAESCYLEAIRLDPAHDEAYFRLGECLFQRERWEGAKGAYESAFRLSKKADYLTALGETHYQMGNYENAQLFFQDACDMAPDECEQWVRLATFQMSIGDYELAVETLNEAAMYSDCLLHINYCKIACLYKNGRRQEALVILQQTLGEHKGKEYQILFDLAPEIQYADAFMATIDAFFA